ncbi:MAG: MarR family winged helix-turn-helix transcriptional regulator [Erysipelotrichaceae bacterium]
MSTKELDRLLLQITHLQNQYNRRFYATHYEGLGMNEVHVLVVLHQEQDANVKRLAQRLQLSKGAITKITQRLCKEGHLTMYQKEENRKEKYFRLEERGHVMVEKHRLYHRLQSEHDELLLSHFDVQEQEVIFRFLTQLRADLQAREEELC